MAMAQGYLVYTVKVGGTFLVGAGAESVVA